MSATASTRGAWRATLHAINKHDKWAVSGTVFALVVRHFGVAAVWTLLGSLVNAVLCKVAKRIINQPRPGSAPKVDPGMPSSHACSITFLSVYAALLLRQEVGNVNLPGHGPAPVPWAHTRAAAAAIVAVGAFLTALRVICGDHTAPQVAAGAALGLTNVGLWYSVARPCIDAIEASGHASTCLYSVTGALSVVFVVWVLSDMLFGWRRRRPEGPEDVGSSAR